MADGRHPGRSASSSATSWRVARALGGALLRLTRATADYVRAAPGSSPTSLASSSDEDTGEWPAPDA